MSAFSSVAPFEPNSFAPLVDSSILQPSAAKKAQPPQQDGMMGGLKIVPQAKIAFIGYVLLTIAMLVRVIQDPKSSMSFIPNILFFMVMYVIAIYMINCTVVGKCNLYAWIVSYVVVVLGILGIVGLILALTK